MDTKEQHMNIALIIPKLSLFKWLFGLENIWNVIVAEYEIQYKHIMLSTKSTKFQ